MTNQSLVASETVLVVGLGSIGRRHVRNLRQIAPSCRIVAWRHSSGGQGSTDVDGAVDEVATSEEAALNCCPRVALATNPASRHVETALALARAGIHVFMEKPISDRLEGVDELLALCHQRNLVLQVGYNLRFYPPIRVLRQALLENRIGRVVAFRAEVGQYLPDWRPGSDYRQGVSARRDLGGGALLELSHELDYARWLMGEIEAVSAKVACLGGLDIDVEDTVEMLLEFDSGAIGSIHMDMVQRVPHRSCRVVGTEGTIEWTASDHSVRTYSAETGEWASLYSAGAMDYNEVYLAELEHFLACVEGNRSPDVTGEDGKRALQIALAARESSSSGRMVKL